MIHKGLSSHCFENPLTPYTLFISKVDSNGYSYYIYTVISCKKKKKHFPFDISIAFAFALLIYQLVPINRKLNSKPRRGAKNNRMNLCLRVTGTWILRRE